MIPTLPAELLLFIELFNRGEFWESHEVLEVPWRRARSDFYKGLILLASAYVHVQRGNARGVAAQLRKTTRHLEAYRPTYLGLDVDALLAHVARCRESVERPPKNDPGRWAAVVPLIRLMAEPSRVRGNEPELRDLA